MTVYIEVFDVTILGIPAKVGVTHYFKQEPMGYWAPSDIDCYGYVDLEYDILDRKGYLAKWLENKLSDNEWDELSSEIETLMESNYV